MYAVSGENTSSFESFLVDKKFLVTEDFKKVRKIQTEFGSGLVSALWRASLMEGRQLAGAISEHYGLPIVEEGDWPEDNVLGNRVSHTFMRERKVLPLSETDDHVVLAMADPGDTYAIEAVKLASGKQVTLKIAALDDIEAAIERLSRIADQPADLFDGEAIGGKDDDVAHLRDLALGTPVVRFVNQLFQDALRMRATDIHIEPFKGRLIVRMRVDGMLREVATPPPNIAKAIISRVKIISGLNIAERRLPQDGRARVNVESHRLDLRIATIPTIHGEAVAIRLLNNVRRSLDFAKLGFCPRDAEVVRKHLGAPYGLFIVTGPTGSGKTTTLATALSLLNDSERKILTVEDPIEYEIDGVNQTQVKPGIGLTFAAALRSFLRHDPDVIMVGEMRDGETASIAINAALTGHLVLTTLHTNSAAGAIPRLLDMGIDAFLLASSLRCVIGQRLVRVLCRHCKAPADDVPKNGAANGHNGHHHGHNGHNGHSGHNGHAHAQIEPHHLGLLNQKEGFWRAVGCDRCFGTGYSDRIAISEVLDVEDKIRALIQPGMSTGELAKAARQRGMTTMLEDGLKKCREGLTTPDEVRRVALDV